MAKRRLGKLTPGPGTAIVRGVPASEHPDADLRDLMKADATTFLPWQKDFVLWYIERQDYSNEAILDKLRELTGTTWSFADWKRLLIDNVAFREFLTIARERGRRLAHALIGYASVDATKAIVRSMKASEDEGDYEATARTADKILTHAFAKRESTEGQRLTINLNLTEAQQKLVDFELDQP